MTHSRPCRHALPALLLSALLTIPLAGCGGGTPDAATTTQDATADAAAIRPPRTPQPAPVPVPTLAEVGSRLFDDSRLSASGTLGELRRPWWLPSAPPRGRKVPAASA